MIGVCTRGDHKNTQFRIRGFMLTGAVIKNGLSGWTLIHRQHILRRKS